MEFLDAPYSPASFQEVREFLVDVYLAGGRLFGWEFTRWEMWTYTFHERKNDAEFFHRNCRLWRDEQGKIAGIFISEGGKEAFALVPRPGTPGIAATMMEWAVTEWGRGKDHLEYEGYDLDDAVLPLLHRYGFVREGSPAHTWRYDLTRGSYDLALPDGYRIASILEHPDFVQRREVVGDAYGGDTDGMSPAEYEWRCSAPGYRGEFDLSLISPEGVFVSCCTGWLDERSRMAVVETVGTRRAYWNRGFARRVIGECFNRLAATGAQTGFITSYSEAAHHTYASLRPVERYDFYTYRRAWLGSRRKPVPS